MMKAAQTTISQIVPMSGDSMPALSGNADGKLVMKSQLRTSAAVGGDVVEQQRQHADAGERAEHDQAAEDRGP